MKYTIEESYYYTSNGCSCCEDDKWVGYRVLEDGDYMLDRQFETQLDAIEYILEQKGFEIEYTFPEEDL